MITLFGATGYTGRLVARRLAGAGLAVRLAGRSPELLRRLAAALPGPPEVVVADVRRPETLPALAEGTDLIVNCAGPFTTLGRPVAALAASRGLRYLDVTNELAYVHWAYTTQRDVAQVTGALLVPACGFEVAIADCAAAALAGELGGDEFDSLDVTYQLPGMGSSYGTRASALRSLETSWIGYRGGAYVAAQPCVETRRVMIAGRELPALSFPSSETMTAPAHLRVRDVRTWMPVTRLGSIYGHRFIPAMLPLLPGPLGWALRLTSRLAARPPSTEVREAMPFAILVELRGGGGAASMTLTGRDPYGLTARLVAYAAQQLLASGERGVVPPARVLDPPQFLAKLADWGVKITTESQRAQRNY